MWEEPARRAPTGWPLLGAILVALALIGGFLIVATHDVTSSAASPLKACGHKAASASRLVQVRFGEPDPFPQGATKGWIAWVQISQSCQHGGRVVRSVGVRTQPLLEAKDHEAEWVAVTMTDVLGSIDYVDGLGLQHHLSFGATG